MADFKHGQLVAYCPTNIEEKPYKVELGVFKKYTADGKNAFVWYHMGSTCACTPLEYLHVVKNSCYITGYVFNSLD